MPTWLACQIHILNCVLAFFTVFKLSLTLSISVAYQQNHFISPLNLQFCSLFMVYLVTSMFKFQLFGNNNGFGHSLEFYFGDCRWILSADETPRSTSRDSPDNCCWRLGMYHTHFYLLLDDDKSLTGK